MASRLVFSAFFVILLMFGSSFWWNRSILNCQELADKHHNDMSQPQSVHELRQALQQYKVENQVQAALLARLSKESESLHQRLQVLESNAPSLVESPPTRVPLSMEPATEPAAEGVTPRGPNVMFKFRGEADANMYPLQKWFSHFLPRPVAVWNEKQHKQQSSALKMLSTTAQQHTGVEWMIGKGCKESKMSSCTEICASEGLRCDKAELSSVSTEASVRAAAYAAGSACGVVEQLKDMGVWDGPWVTNVAGPAGVNLCKYAIGKSSGDCNKNIPCGFRRICPCARTDAAIRAELPSEQRHRKMQWHRQWDHKCDIAKQQLHAMATASGSKKIPNHLLFVLLWEREAWIDWSYPFQLINSSHPLYQQLTQAEQLLIENMRNSLILNDASSVHFVDELACISALSQISQDLLTAFLSEQDIRYKTDICRVAALYLEGGYYFDDDMLAYMSVIPFIRQDTEFASVEVEEDDTIYFQSFMASVPCHPILRRNADLLVQARKPQASKDIFYLLGPKTLKLAFDEVKANHTQLFIESPPPNVEDLRYQHVPDRNGFKCGHRVWDPASKKVIFCSRIA